MSPDFHLTLTLIHILHFSGEVQLQKTANIKENYNVWKIRLPVVSMLPNCSQPLRGDGPTAHICIFNLLIGWYWLTDPFPGFHQWVRRQLWEPLWEPSWQLLSIKLSCTPSLKATREVSVLQSLLHKGRVTVAFTQGPGWLNFQPIK